MSGVPGLGLFAAISGRIREHGDRILVAILLVSVLLVIGRMNRRLKHSKSCRPRFVAASLVEYVSCRLTLEAVNRRRAVIGQASGVKSHTEA